MISFKSFLSEALDKEKAVAARGKRQIILCRACDLVLYLTAIGA